MSKSDAQQRMEALKATSARLVLAEFLKDRLETKEGAFVSCTKDTFEVHKGRCLELKELINYIESRG